MKLHEFNEAEVRSILTLKGQQPEKCRKMQKFYMAEHSGVKSLKGEPVIVEENFICKHNHLRLLKLDRIRSWRC